MKVPISWLNEYVDLSDLSVKDLSDKLTFSGVEVEGIEDRAKDLASFTIGYVVEAVQHPNADKLRVCKVDTGKSVVQVV